MNIAEYLTTTTSEIERKLDQLIPHQTHCSQLFSAARYALLGGGKRLRPILTLATAETLGTPVHHALHAACAIEMIHTYSLIHDDLPCMDDDDYRRGKPSVHKVFSEGHAVLTGDYLLTFAFEVIAQDEYLTAGQKVSLMATLAKNSGAYGMIGGQIMDIEAEGQVIDLETLSHIHRHKTGAMITASVEFGAIIGKATPYQMGILRSFGNEIGLAFQIIDDILDVTASAQKEGKMRSSDKANGKTTYATLMGVKAAEKIAGALLDQSYAHLQKLDCDTTLLKALADKFVLRTK